jgi:hypothetical protein
MYLLNLYGENGYLINRNLHFIVPEETKMQYTTNGRTKMEKRRTRGINYQFFLGVFVGFLVLFIFSGIVDAAQVATSNLKAIHPVFVKPGTVVKFEADIYYNQAFGEPPGKRLRIFVTRSDYSWVSDKIDITYPASGSVHVNFANGFTIPANAQPGQVFDFYIVYGPWWVMSNKASVKVSFTIDKKEVSKQKVKSK